MEREQQIEKLAEYLVSQLKETIKSATRTCLTCQNWDKTSELCMKFDNQKPPAYTIAYGCPSYDEQIPF